MSKFISKFMIVIIYPISKHKTDTYLFCYADDGFQASFILNKLQKKVDFVIRKLSSKYSTYLYKHPKCKMNEYINGLFKLNFKAIEVPNYSHNLLKTNDCLINAYPKKFNLSSEEAKLDNIIKNNN